MSYKEFVSYNKNKEGVLVRVPIKEYNAKFKDLEDGQVLVSSYTKKNGVRVLQLRSRSTSVDVKKRHLLHHVSFTHALQKASQDPKLLYFANKEDQALWEKKVQNTQNKSAFL